MAGRGGSAPHDDSLPPPLQGLPPSTIAAQIVHNAPNTATNSEPETKAVFRQLLQEYLNDPSTDESSSQLNVQLLSVVAEAGLDVLLHENPFALDLLVPQAIDSISVIKLTLQRRPQLLVSPRTEDATNAQPTMLIWLFSKLLALLGRHGPSAIQAHIQDLLSSCVRILRQSLDLWTQGSTVVQLYLSSIDGTRLVS